MASSIPRLFRDLVERGPEREVIGFGPGPGAVVLHRGELWRRAEAFASALEALEPGSRVLLVMPLEPDLVAAHLGTMLRRAIPIIHSHPSEKVAPEVYARQLAHALALLKPEAVVVHRAFLGAVERAAACRVVVAETVDSGGPVTAPGAWESAAGEDVALIQHSSGSTGLQKGVALTHAMVASQCESYARAIAAEPGRDRVCAWLPLYHDMGLFTSWLLPLLHGIPVSTLDPFAWVQDPASLLRLITERRGTLCWQPNFAYNLLATRVRDEELAGIDLSSMRGFTNCSEPARASSHRMFLERLGPVGVTPAALWVCYAMAENAFAVTAAGGARVPVLVRECDPEALSRGVVDAPRQAASEVVSVGTPVDGCEVRVVDGARESLPERRVGEVAIRSSFLMRGYYGNPEATAAAMEAGWYHTGDLGFLDGGQLYVTGRKKDLLIVGGRNFYPQDVEAVCDGCEGAVPGRSVAIGVEDERTGTDRIVVLVESREMDPTRRDELVRTARRRIVEELDCPVAEIHVVPHMWLVKTSSGKIARRPNLERFRQETRAAPARAGAADREPGIPGILRAIGWGLAAAAALYVIAALDPSISWGLYAGF